MFLEDCPLRVDAIGAALASGDTAALVSSAHTLKGSAAYLKASIVRHHAAEIERCAREGRTDDATAEFERLRVAAVNIPPPVQAVVEYVPRGKGMAGVALASGEPVQTCHLKDDASSNVRP